MRWGVERHARRVRPQGDALPEQESEMKRLSSGCITRASSILRGDDGDCSSGRRAVRVAPGSGRGTRLTIVAAIAVGATVVASCRRAAPIQETSHAVPVEVMQIVPARLEETTSIAGVLDAYRAVDVVSEVVGRIERVYHDVGDRVRTGTRLASVDKAVLQETLNQAEAALLGAQARFELAHDDFRRDSTLFAHGDIAVAAFDASRTAYTAALADLSARMASRELVARDLREADIRAPFAGIVARRSVDIGTFVSQGTPLFRVVDVDSLRLVLSVSQKNVGRLTPGDEVVITVEALGDRRFAGRIRSVSPEADEATRTFPVEVILENPPDKPLRDGLVVRAVIVLGALEQAVAIPREAIIKRTGGHFVFVVADSMAHQRSVTVGRLIGDRYAIEDGLQPGERMVVTGAQNLEDGVRVVVEDEVTAGPNEDTES